MRPTHAHGKKPHPKKNLTEEKTRVRKNPNKKLYITPHIEGSCKLFSPGAPNNPGPDSSSISSKHQIPQAERNMCIKNDHHSDEEITYLHLLLQQKEKQTCLPPRNVAESVHLFTANHLNTDMP